LSPGFAATVNNIGTSGAAVFDFGIPQGADGTAATIAAGTTTTLAPNSPATVANVGSPSAAVFNFGIPQGTIGATGPTGPVGPQGPAATIAVGSTTTLSPGASATVNNSGTSGAAVFDFGIPQGPTGTAATIAVGTTTSLAPGNPATVTNVGTSGAAVFNFGIPTAGGIAAGGSTTQVQYNLGGVLAGSANMTFNGTTFNLGVNTILSNVNVLGASYDSVSFSVATQDTSPTDVFFSPDGLRMYVLGDSSNLVNEYNLSTAWVVSSAVFSTSFSVASQDGVPQGLFFRADGTKMYMVGSTNDTVYQYTLSTPWSVSTALYDSISFSVAGQETIPTGISFRSNGLSMYVLGNSGDAVYQYTLSTAWNISTATFLQSFSISGQEATANGMCFTGDGTRMFIAGSSGDDVNVYNLTTPWDISTATFVSVFSVSGQDTFPTGLYIKPDGTKMYIVGQTNDTVYQYTVPSIDIQLTGPTSAAALDVQQDLNVYGNTTGSFLNNGFRENISGQYYNLVSQADIGSAPNEIPLNQYLGNLAYQDAANIAGPVGVGGALTVVGATTLTSTVGIGTTSPSASAILDAQSTTKGVRMPNMTTTQKNAIASPAAGLMVFDTTLAKLSVYSGVAWETITSL
jgi:sugar lactone lactonase YvrE